MGRKGEQGCSFDRWMLLWLSRAAEEAFLTKYSTSTSSGPALEVPAEEHPCANLRKSFDRGIAGIAHSLAALPLPKVRSPLMIRMKR